MVYGQHIRTTIATITTLYNCCYCCSVVLAHEIIGCAYNQLNQRILGVECKRQETILFTKKYAKPRVEYT